MVAQSPHSKKAMVHIPAETFLCELCVFACSPMPQLSPMVQKHASKSMLHGLIGVSKLPLGVHVSVWVWGSATYLQPFQVVLPSLDSRSRNPMTPKSFSRFWRWKYRWTVSYYLVILWYLFLFKISYKFKKEKKSEKIVAQMYLAWFRKPTSVHKIHLN